jgi:hypothetical protein
VHHDGTTPHATASSFVNPLTALGMVETMRMEGHTALVHTAAASSLGIMLNKVCIKESVALVNIVRKQEQVDLLTKLAAKIGELYKRVADEINTTLRLILRWSCIFKKP